jgi:hypothetical protein
MHRKMTRALAVVFAAAALGAGAGAGAAPLAEGLAAAVRVGAPAATVALGEPAALDVWLENTGGAGFDAPAQLEDAGVVAEITDARGVVRRMNAASIESMLRARPSVSTLLPGVVRGQRIVIDRNPSTGERVFGEAGVYAVRFEVGGYASAEAVTVTVREPNGFERSALDALDAEEARLRALPATTAAERLAGVMEREESDRRFIRRFEGTPYAHHRRLALAASVVVEYSGARRPGYAEAEALLSAAADAPGFARRDEALAELVKVRERQGKGAEAEEARRRLGAIEGTPIER